MKSHFRSKFLLDNLQMKLLKIEAVDIPSSFLLLRHHLSNQYDHHLLHFAHLPSSKIWDFFRLHNAWNLFLFIQFWFKSLNFIGILLDDVVFFETEFHLRIVSLVILVFAGSVDIWYCLKNIMFKSVLIENYHWTNLKPWWKNRW